MFIKFVSPKTNSTSVPENGFSSEVWHNSLYFNIPNMYGWGIKPVNFLTYTLRQEIVLNLQYFYLHGAAWTVEDR